MDIFFHHSYNLDLLNLLNIVGGDSPYNEVYPQIYAEFGHPLSTETKEILHQLAIALGTSTISAPIAFALSIIPQFEKAVILDLLLDHEGYHAAIEQFEPRLMPQKDQLLFLFQVLAPVLQELENLGFRDYWLSDCRPLLEDRLDKLDPILLDSPLSNNLHQMIESGILPEEIHVYLCALNGGKGVRLSQYRTIVDISFSDDRIFDFCLHEIFHLALSNSGIENILALLSTDTFLQLAHEKSKSLTGIETIESYLQENIKEAYISYLLYISGLLPDPLGFLQAYKQGAFVLSVIIIDHLIWNGMEGESMLSHLKLWLETNPVGNSMELYKQALDRAGKIPGEQ
ncbi:MAG TPA: hypothetical protein VK856_01180 [Anaerolineaceae bacterium]|nr:hypothetical protein [Anaerolineaceae bacterium]